MSEAQRAEWVERAVSGNADALQRLFIHYHDVLLIKIDQRADRAIRRHLDPEDVLQCTYITALAAISNCRFDGPGGFYAWLETIALRKLAEMHRGLHAEKRDIDRDLHDGSHAGNWNDALSSSYCGLLSHLPGSGTTPSGHMTTEERNAVVTSSLARLTEDQRLVIRLRFLEHRPPAEVAAQLGKSEDAVYMLCHRGMKALEELIGEMSRPLHA